MVDDTLNERFDAELEGFELIPRYNTVLRRRRGIGWLLRWHHMVLWSIQAFLVERTMRITLALDDELLAKAQALTAMTEKSALVQEALRALIQRESADPSVGSQPPVQPGIQAWRVALERLFIDSRS